MPGRARLGRASANTPQAQRPVNGLWEDHLVDECTPELMGSVSTELLRKENPEPGWSFHVLLLLRVSAAAFLCWF